jgi:hypothetical protein
MPRAKPALAQRLFALSISFSAAEYLHVNMSMQARFNRLFVASQTFGDKASIDSATSQCRRASSRPPVCPSNTVIA